MNFQKCRPRMLLLITAISTLTTICEKAIRTEANPTAIMSKKLYHKSSAVAQTTDCGVRPYRRSMSDSSERKRFLRSNLSPAELLDDELGRNRDHLRTAKIIAGLYTNEGQFPWQASLELLHPSLGFLGHWCGAVLIHRYWVLSAAHCIHNDLFNLPLPPLWTVVLGEYDRAVESGFEQRVPIEKIVLHRKYENFLNDLVLMKLSRPANLSIKSNIRRICLPIHFNDEHNYNEGNSEHINVEDDDLDQDLDQDFDQDLLMLDNNHQHIDNSNQNKPNNQNNKSGSKLKNNNSNKNNKNNNKYNKNNEIKNKLFYGEKGQDRDELNDDDDDPDNPIVKDNHPRIGESGVNYGLLDLMPEGSEIPEKMENFLRSVQTMQRYPNITIPTMKQLMDLKILNRLKKINTLRRPNSNAGPWQARRRNDKYLVYPTIQQQEQLRGPQHRKKLVNSYPFHHLRRLVNTHNKDLPYIDCLATGWGKANISGDLTDQLLKTAVPLHNNKRCREAYGSFVRIHRGHLCAGKLNGKGGTCVGDSGGPLQCRLTKNGPWLLAGITSFGSGCAIEGYPDVYVRTSYYMKWIQDTIAYE